jgi:hypothetical protein
VDIVGEAPKELELTILIQILARRFVRSEKELADVDARRLKRTGPNALRARFSLTEDLLVFHGVVETTR